ncbi:MAG: TetR/AcrR family transcriptional regulator [Caldilineaceae bacterium]|nr:TetR/AcrR family transcriptional regulator [Caldilineaceae bacterium]
MAKRRRLDRATVVAQAAALADAAGSVQGVSLADLAAALDIRAPSLYNHIGGLDDLHRELALFAMQQLLVRLRAAAAGRVGRDALMTLAAAYRHFAQEHPGIYPLTLRAPGPEDAALIALAQELLQMLLLILASLGVQGDDALHAIRGLRALLHGFTTLEAAEGFKMPLNLDESFRRLMTAYLAGLTPTAREP